MRFLNRAGKSREPSVAHAMALVQVTGAGRVNRFSRSTFAQRSQPSACKVQASRPPVSGLFPVATFPPSAAEVA